MAVSFSHILMIVVTQVMVRLDQYAPANFDVPNERADLQSFAQFPTLHHSFVPVEFSPSFLPTVSGRSGYEAAILTPNLNFD